MASKTLLNIQGLQRTTSPFIAKEGELTRCVNFNGDVWGGLQRRAGLTTFLNNPDNAQVNFLYYWKDQAQNKFLFRGSGTALYMYKFTGSTFPAFSTTYTNGATLNAAPLDNILFFASGKDPLFYFNSGSTAFSTAMIGTPPINPAYLTTFKNRLYASGATSNPSDIFWSTYGGATIGGGTGGGTNWTTSITSSFSAGQIPVDPDFKGQIKQIGVNNNRIMIYKTFGMYKISININTDQPDEVISVPTNVSSYAPAGIVKVEQGDEDWFIHPTGVYSYAGDQPVVQSLPIRDYVLGINSTALTNCAAGALDYKLYFSVGTVTATNPTLTDFNQTYSNAVLVFDWLLKRWYVYTYPYMITAFCTIEDTDGTLQLLAGDSTGNVYYMNKGNDDNGVGIEAEWETQPQFLDGPDLDKKFNAVTAYTNPGTEMRISYHFDDEDDWRSLGDLPGWKNKKLAVPGAIQKKSISLYGSQRTRGGQGVFYGAIINYDVEGDDATIRRRARK